MKRASDAARAEVEALIARCGIGDRRAFSDLYDRTAPKLYGVALRVLADRGAAEDVLQEAYVKIWAGAGRYVPGAASPMTWLITITRNAAIDRLRRAGGQTAQPMGEDALAVPAPTPGPEAQAIAASERARLDACLAKLPADRAAAVRGAYLDGETYATLAARHGVPLNTMRSWLRRALIALRECLSR